MDRGGRRAGARGGGGGGLRHRPRPARARAAAGRALAGRRGAARGRAAGGARAAARRRGRTGRGGAARLPAAAAGVDARRARRVAAGGGDARDHEQPLGRTGARSRLPDRARGGGRGERPRPGGRPAAGVDLRRLPHWRPDGRPAGRAARDGATVPPAAATAGGGVTAEQPERSLVVWCPDWPVQAAAAAAALPLEAPIALLDKGLVHACSAAARGEGVRRGLKVREAQSRCASLAVLPYNPALDARSFEPVLEAIEAGIPTLQVVRPGVVVIRAQGPARYYGGEREAALAVLGLLG